MANLGLGFFLMAVGMVTVFAILLIVIYGSRGIIKLLNRIVISGDISPKTKLILEGAVAELTSGKGRITKITKI